MWLWQAYAAYLYKLEEDKKALNTKAQEELDTLTSMVQQCTRCPLHEGRNQVVFGSGNTSARVMIVGEAPGKNEDEQGVPFVGRAGDNLEKLLSYAGLRKDEVYIANVLKCRPPSNRNPHVFEIEQCADYLRAQVALVRPEIIITLGNFATKFILKNEEGITKLRGKLVDCGSFKVLPVFHPASALYDRKKMDALIADFSYLGDILAGKDAAEAFSALEGESFQVKGESRTQDSLAKPLEYDVRIPDDFDPLAYINAPRNFRIVPGLERIRELMHKLGNPHEGLRLIHVAGTNGKGSVCAMLESVLREAGYKTGLFTSPYIYNFEERIRVSGTMISKQDVRKHTWRIAQAAESMEESPSEFELMTALGLLHFAEECCDIVIMEVGLGGRLDSTNIISPLLSIITKLGLDHQDFLGNTLEDIAREKAGIIKREVPVLTWPQRSLALKTIENVAVAQHAPVLVPEFDKLELHYNRAHADKIRSQEISYKQHKKLPLALLGAYQPYNAALVLEALDILATKGFSVREQELVKGFERVSWPGRFERVSTEPVVIFDGAHNVDGIEALLQSLNLYYPQSAVHCVVSLMRDKNYEAMLARLVPRCASIHACSAGLERSLDPRSIVSCAKTCVSVNGTGKDATDACKDVSCKAYETPQEALAGAWKCTGKHDIIVVAGSLYGLAPLKQALDALKG